MYLPPQSWPTLSIYSSFPYLLQVELTCEDPYLFAHLNTSITFTCDPITFNWTFVDAESCTIATDTTIDITTNIIVNVTTTIDIFTNTTTTNTTCDSAGYLDDPNLLRCRLRESPMKR